MKYLFGAVVIAAAVITGAVLIDIAMTPTGPNCPGMDPAWLGFCEEGM